ncbi:MmgE/PrpD family protein [Mesorhizobium sp. DCY119]|uniref:MmgE/PrpD family protein n=1 Tax=Mesorhizobium sp. DCY119 TaxID=2108445 RepID=UPI000E76AD32|nr:MmgE/PrpD family protein [Mesorhizobium sp. DCY119]RJG40852.1 MmgE/PrpD family protein [Mesorhizobium sp. DCY119]
MSGELSRPPVTRWLAERACTIRREDLPDTAVTIARQCILDWFAVTLPGASEPAVTLLADELLSDGARPTATLVGLQDRTSAANAALINGTASHAIDFDDVNMAILGHPTVAILPGLLALAEEISASQDEVLAAFVAGYDVVCRTGALMSPGHYHHGFHATATVGSIGAAAVCARLLKLDAETTATAYGIAATMASGLKSMFGTMCKPLHAGRAAQNGLQAARLAKRGFTSRQDALECAQGMAATQSIDFNPEEAMKDAPLDHHIVNNLFKYHASCYLTHGAIEAGKAVRERHAVSSNAIQAVEIRVPPVTDRVCNIAAPRTGLEAKFSLRLTVAMALAGRDTSGIATYTDALTQEPELVRLRDMATISFDEALPEAKAEIVVRMADGARLSSIHDAGVADTDLVRQGLKLAAKFDALVVPVIGGRATALRARLTDFGGEEAVGGIMALAWGGMR